MFCGVNPAFGQWNRPFEHADVPGSSDPSTQSQKSSFTCARGIFFEPSRHVKRVPGGYKACRVIDTPLIRSDANTAVKKGSKSFITEMIFLDPVRIRIQNKW